MLKISKKNIFRLGGVLIFLFLFSATYLLLPDGPKSKITVKPEAKVDYVTWNNVATNTIVSQEKNKASPKLTAELPASTSSPTPSIPIDIKPTTTATETPKDEIKNPINVIIEIAGAKHNLAIEENATVYDAMISLINNKSITAEFKEFKGMGYFIEEINGIKGNNKTSEYWFFYINGESSMIGISQYKLKNNDLITWKYTKSL